MVKNNIHNKSPRPTGTMICWNELLVQLRLESFPGDSLISDLPSYYTAPRHGAEPREKQPSRVSGIFNAHYFLS